MSRHPSERTRTAARWRRGLPLLLLLAALPPGRAAAQLTVFDPGNHAQNVVQLARTLTMLQQQLQQIDNQLQALRKLSRPAWRELPGYFRELDVLLRRGDALAYGLADLGAQLRTTFPGEQLPADLDLSRVERRQLERTLATLHGALLSTQRQMQQVGGGLAELRRIKQQMSGIRGHQEALELGNTLQAFGAEETMQLRQQMAVLNNLLAVQGAREMQQRLQARAARQRILANTAALSRNLSPGLRTTWEE